ncbi:MAG: glucosamine-6-phosphate deaminase [Cyanobium sp.]
MEPSSATTTREWSWSATAAAEGSGSPVQAHPSPIAEGLRWESHPLHPAAATASLPAGSRLLVLPDAAAVAGQVSSTLLQEALRPQHRPLGLATGRTMEAVYAALADQLRALEAPEAERLRRGWCSFNLDEYVGLGPADPSSFAAEMAARLSGPLNLDPAAVQLPDGLAADPDTEAARYREAVDAAGGIGLQLLGLGLNGHVGFNEPPCGAHEGCRCLALSPATRLQNAAAFGGDPEAVPERAITLGLREIQAAERLLLVVTGAAKAEVLRRALREPPTPELPASWIQAHPALTVVADAPAAAGLF